MTKHIRLPSVYVPDETVLKLVEAAADKKGMSKSAWVRWLIQEELRRNGHDVNLDMQHGGRRPYGEESSTKGE